MHELTCADLASMSQSAMSSEHTGQFMMKMWHRHEPFKSQPGRWFAGERPLLSLSGQLCERSPLTERSPLRGHAVIHTEDGFAN